MEPLPFEDDPDRPALPDGPRPLARHLPANLAADSPAAALAGLLDQANREAAANRAQARELIKALDGVQRSHEYLGKALLGERRRSRWLGLALLLAPLVAVVCVILVWKRVDRVRDEVDARMTRIAEREQAAREEAAARAHAERLAEQHADLAALRGDLDAVRDALAGERRRVADREEALAAAVNQGESARTEVSVLDFEVKSARAKATAESGRATFLESRIKELQVALAAKDRPAVAEAREETALENVTAPAPTGATAEAARGDSVLQPKSSPLPAPSDPAEVARSRAVLNHLLEACDDAVHYRFEEIGCVVGDRLGNVRVVGVDARGEVVRTIVAERAEIVVDPEERNVVLRFSGGRLLVGMVEAPFFQGTYGLAVRGDPARWKAASLGFVRAD